jgi:hypothetical protein
MVTDEKVSMEEKTVRMDEATPSLSTAAPSTSEKAFSELAPEQPIEEAAGLRPSTSPVDHADPGLKKVMSAKEAQAELSKIMTSGEGVEYPTGLKLNLISLAVRTLTKAPSSCM